MADKTLADLAEMEDKNRRSQWISNSFQYFRRYYPVPSGFVWTLPRPGSVVPDATADTPPFIVRDGGASGSPAGSRSQDEEGVIVLTAAKVILNSAGDTETYTYGA